MSKSDQWAGVVHQVPPVGRTVLATAVAAVIAGLGTPGFVLAQGATTELEEIVVTATRRAESLQEVPISLAVFTQEKMDQQGLRDVADIANFTPSVSFQQGDGLRSLNQRISIRGVSSNVGGATTGIYINDTPIAVRTLRTNGDPNATAFPRLFDIDRVEVLRGPQGTLFGSGSEGGTVRFILPEPNLTGSSAYARVGTSVTEYGGSSWEAGFAGGTAIVEDKLGLRASYSKSETGGVVDHGDYYTGKIDQADHDGQKAESVQVAMKWRVTDDFTISPFYYYQDLHADGQSSFMLPDDKRGAPTSGPALAAYNAYYARYNGQFNNYGHFGDGIEDGRYVNVNGVISSSSQRMNLAAINFKYAFSGVDLIYNVSQYRGKQTNLADWSWWSFGILPFFAGGGSVDFPSDPTLTASEIDTNKNTVETHELRVQSSNPDARVNWVFGLYVNDQEARLRSAPDDGDWGRVLPDAIPGFTSPFCPTLSTCNFPWMYFYQDPNSLKRHSIYLDTWGWDKERAVFGQADINITDHLQATVGLRYSDMSFRSILWSAGVIDGPPIVEDKTTDSTLLSPKVGLKYTFADDQMIYASAAKGGRNGGVNQLISTPPCLDRLRDVWGMPNGAPKYYEGDSVWSYELGAKFTIRNKLVVDAAVYQIDWEDMIRSVGIGGNQCIFSFTTNLGTATSRGGEISIQYYPSDNLMLSATAGKAKVQSTSNIYVPDPLQPDGIAKDAQGRVRYVTRDGAIQAGSNTTVNFAAQYSFQAFDRESYARMDYRYVAAPSKGDAWNPQSSQYPVGGALNLFETPTVSTANVRLGTNVNNWDLSLFVNNVTNTQPIQKFRQGDVGAVNGAWMTGSLMTRPREVGVTAVYRY